MPINHPRYHSIKAKPEKEKSPSFILSAIKWLVMLTIWGAVFAMLMAVWFGYDLPDGNKLLQITRKPGITIVDRKGGLISTHGDIYGRPVEATQLPTYVPGAILAIEDRRFYKHFGVDIIGILRAAWVNLQAHRTVQGGSTITQQLAKNFLLSEKMYTHTDKSLRRKVQEVLLSVWLEHKFTKEQILSMYLNRVYLGSGVYGIEAAALKYFHKHARNLNLYESAVIAGLLKAPSKYSPTSSPKNADERAQIVLDAMLDAGFITAAQRSSVKPSIDSMTRAHQKMQTGQYFADWVMDVIPDLIGEIDRDIIVVTTYDPQMQIVAEQSASSILNENKQIKNVSQLALISMTYDGAVRAMVGGIDHDLSKFNRATQAKRQAGSSFKTFVFLAGLENGMDPDTMIPDGPIKIGKWQPKNYHWESRGEISLSTAFAYSVNTVAVRIAQTVGKKRIAEIAHRLGITTPIQNDLSIALGTADVSLIELTGAFTSMSNGGVCVDPYGVVQIRDRQGNVLYQHKSCNEEVINPTTASYIKQLLISVGDYGYGRTGRIEGTYGGKTGTSQDYHDAWYVGFSDKHQLVTGVWFGNDDQKPMKKVTGGTLPLKLWQAFYNSIK